MQTNSLIDNYKRMGHCPADTAGHETFRASDGVIRVRGEINGILGVFIIDTGASYVTIDEAFAKKAGLSFQNSWSGKAITPNGVIEGRFATARTITVGQTEAHNVTVMVDERPLEQGLDDGLLGMSFLSRFDISLKPGQIQISARPTTTGSQH